jgi:flagellar biosynthesis protein
MNPNKAIALKYQNNSQAPQVAAKGTGYTANKIMELAKEHNIPIQKDESLVSLLMNLEINEQIPESLYQVVAEIFAYLYKLDQLQGKNIMEHK